jgi:hypothetical protein
MKTIINKITGKELFVTVAKFEETETEVAIDELRTEHFANPFFNQTTRVFYEGGTIEEVMAWQDRKEAQEDSQRVKKLDLDSNQLYLKHKERINRRVIKGALTADQSKNIRKLLREAHLYLKTGDFDLALDVLNEIPTQTNKIQSEIDWLKDRINDNITMVLKRAR